jgi:hypothetical protein
MKKIMFLSEHKINKRLLDKKIEDFTTNNGCYPDRIDMDAITWCRFLNIIKEFNAEEKNGISFRGISIEEEKTDAKREDLKRIANNNKIMKEIKKLKNKTKNPKIDISVKRQLSSPQESKVKPQSNHDASK